MASRVWHWARWRQVLAGVVFGGPELDIDPDTAYYFLSRVRIRCSATENLPRWRKRLFLWLAHNAASLAAYLGLPEDRTVVMGFQVEL